MSRGEGSGPRPPPCTLSPGREGRGEERRGLWAERAPRFICLRIPFLRLPSALTQKRGLSRGSARVLPRRVKIGGSSRREAPRAPLAPRLPKRRWPCVGYFGCRSKVVQVIGRLRRGRGRGQGWGGVEVPRTHPPAGGPGAEARAGQWVLPSTSASGEGLVSHRGFQPSHSEPAS